MKKILKTVLIIYLPFYTAAIILFQFQVISELVLVSAVYAGLLNIINFAAASAAFVWTLKKDNKKFLIFNLGGMGVRLFFLLSGIFILLNFLKIDFYAFILVFFVFYFIFLFVEVYNFHKTMESVKRIKNI
ncbi:MAG: hypothetical protein D8M61_01555 [Ignavibacteriae bacterium]|nr:hypothetical protein [Ignavibacteriota bacterium]